MANSTAPVVACEEIHPGLVVSDLAAAIEFYEKRLGFRLVSTWGDPATFAGVTLGKVQVYLMRGVPTPSATGASVFFSVGDVDELYAFHRASGVEVVEEIGDRVFGMRDYVVKDLYGYRLVFGQYI